MTQLIDDVAYLSDEIGARPAGTEEEQQAALFVAESLQRDSGFQAIIEDFSGMSNPDLPKAICFGVAFVCGLVALLVPLLMLPAAIVSLVMALLYGLEVVGRPVLSRFLKGGVSQNVVAKYQPAGVPNKKRKIILVANYDSGRVVPEQKGFLKQNRRVFELVLAGGLALLPILMLLRAIVFPSASGMVETFFNVLIVLSMIVVAVPVALTIVHSRAQYTEAANNNATGVAVLLDVARKVGTGCVSLEEMERMAAEEGIELEGEQAARDAGVIPEGAELEYRTEENTVVPGVPEAPVDNARTASEVNQELADESFADAEKLADSTNPENADSESDLVSEDAVSDTQEKPDRRGFEFDVPQPAAPATPFPVGTMSGGIPSWARSAQAKAHENKPEQAMVSTPAVRSRYADTPAAQILNREVATHTGAFAPVAEPAPVTTPVVSPESDPQEPTSVPEAEKETVEPEAHVPVQVPTAPHSSFVQDRQRSGSFNNPWSEAASTTASADLSARLAALRSEIQSAPVPHVSDEVRKAFDAMDELDSKQTAVVSRETINSDGADSDAAPVVSAETRNEARREALEAPVASESKDSEQRELPRDARDSQPASANIENEQPVIENDVRDEESRSDSEQGETSAPVHTARSLRRPSTKPFGGFMEKIHKVAENVADAASDMGSRIGEAASEAGSRFAAATPDAKAVTEDGSEDAALSREDESLAQSKQEEVTERETVESDLKSLSGSVEADTSKSDDSEVDLEDGLEEGSSPEDDLEETRQDDSTNVSADVQEVAPSTSKTIHRAKTVVREEDSVEDMPGDDGRFDDSEEPLSEQGASGAFDALDEDSFDMDAEPEAVAAIDVSSFMNKTLDVSAPQPVVSEDSDAADEVTRPVSMAEVREAIAQVSENHGDSPARSHASASEKASQMIEQNVPSARDTDKTMVASPIVGLDLTSIPSIGETSGDRRQLITLPDLDASRTDHAEVQSQRAPMATTATAHSPLSSGVLPRIGADDFALENQTSSDRFGLDLPPLGAESEVSHEKVSTTSSFSTAGGTGAFAPVGDELVEGVPEENLYIDDADDSSFEENHTETGAFAGPEYVDLPQSRVGKFFGRFGSKKKKAQEENSVHEWIGADEDYTAHGAGVDRGSWESFRDDSDEPKKTDSGSWRGGAFNLDTLRALSEKAGKASGERNEAGEEECPLPSGANAGEVIVDDFNMPAAQNTNTRVEELNREMHQINEFRHPGIDTEVWFVALGSEVGSNSGMEAFLANHADELDGAIIVNLQALGAGKLSYIDTEGIMMPVKPTSRMKRFVRNAAARTGVSVTNAKLLSVETPAGYAMRHGLKAFSIVGVKDGKPAYYAEPEDRIENVNEKTLESASKFVMELLKVM